MQVFFGSRQQSVLGGAQRIVSPCDTEPKRSSPPGPADRARNVAGTIRDIGLIMLAWMIFIGVVVYPAAQLVGLLTCAIALLVTGKPRCDAITRSGP